MLYQILMDPGKYKMYKARAYESSKTSKQMKLSGCARLTELHAQGIKHNIQVDFYYSLWFSF